MKSLVLSHKEILSFKIFLSFSWVQKNIQKDKISQRMHGKADFFQIQKNSKIFHIV